MSKYMGYNGKRSLKTWVTSHFLGKTDRAADAALLGGKPPEYYAGPVNLLVNSYFINPYLVNQRGKTNYTTSGQPTIDRWVLVGSGTLNVFDGYVSLVKNSGEDVDLQQNLENYDRMKGQTYTIGVGNINGRTYAATFTMGQVAAGIALGGCKFYSVDNRNILFRVAKSDGWRWAALYEGEYTADTFPPPTPHPYSVGLAECQRYFERIGNRYSELLSTTTLADGQRYAMFLIRYAPKRITPTIILSDPSNYRVLTKGMGDNIASAHSIESLSVYSVMNTQAAIIAKMNGDVHANNAILQRSDSATAAWIDVSADL